MSKMAAILMSVIPILGPRLLRESGLSTRIWYKKLEIKWKNQLKS
jgi:hypothetical protein